MIVLGGATLLSSITLTDEKEQPLDGSLRELSGRAGMGSSFCSSTSRADSVMVSLGSGAWEAWGRGLAGLLADGPAGVPH